MPTEQTEAPTSQEPTVKAVKSDEKKSSNVKGDQVVQALLKRAEVQAQGSTPTETLAEAAQAEEVKTAGTVAAQETTASEEAKSEEAKADSEEAKEVLSHDSSLPPEIQEKIDKRIGKEVAKRKALEAELEQLKGQRAQAITTQPPPKVDPTPENPLAHLTDITSLQKEMATAKEAKRFAQELLDRDDIDKGVTVGDHTYSKQQLKQAVRNAERTIEDYIPQREKFLRDFAQYETVAAQYHEWFKDPTSPERKVYEVLIRDPEIARKNNGPWIAATLAKGEADLQRAIQCATNLIIGTF